MIGWLTRLFARGEPALSEASARDATAIATLHAASFRHGWSDGEFERLLLERNIVAHRATVGRRCTASSCRGSPAAKRKSFRSRSHRRAAAAASPARCSTCICGGSPGLGAPAVFLEVDEDNEPARRLYQRAGFREVGRRPGYYQQGRDHAATALVLRRDLI